MVEPSTETSTDSVMIKYLPRTSSELFLLLELNHREVRADPWNPVPHILCAVERGDRVFLCMQRLVEYDQPPLKTIANYIDLFRQLLEVRLPVFYPFIIHMKMDFAWKGPGISARTFYR